MVDLSFNGSISQRILATVILFYRDNYITKAIRRCDDCVCKVSIESFFCWGRQRLDIFFNVRTARGRETTQRHLFCYLIPTNHLFMQYTKLFKWWFMIKDEKWTYTCIDTKLLWRPVWKIFSCCFLLPFIIIAYGW